MCWRFDFCCEDYDSYCDLVWCYGWRNVELGCGLIWEMFVGIWVLWLCRDYFVFRVDDDEGLFEG